MERRAEETRGELCDVISILTDARRDRAYKYSCFEESCPTKPYRTMSKGIMGNGVHGP